MKPSTRARPRVFFIPGPFLPLAHPNESPFLLPSAPFKPIESIPPPLSPLLPTESMLPPAEPAPPRKLIPLLSKQKHRKFRKRARKRVETQVRMHRINPNSGFSFTTHNAASDASSCSIKRIVIESRIINDVTSCPRNCSCCF